MCSNYIPQDLAILPDGFSMDPLLSSRLPSRPKNRSEKWDQAKTAALTDIDNWRKWDIFFKTLEDSWTSAGSKEAAAAVHRVVESAFFVFLRRFPYSVAHWRQFSLLQYKMAGVDASVKCLKDSVAECPQSVALWVDYLSALLTVEAEGEAGELVEKNEILKAEQSGPEKKSGDIPITLKSSRALDLSSKDIKTTSDFIRGEFQRAAEIIGWNFNSDGFWNKYIEFETSNAQYSVSPHLTRVYLRLIRIPLYQYAQYYNQFTEINKSFKFTDLIGVDELSKYLITLGKSSVEELSVVEQHQIIDNFSYNIFTQTQAQVSRKWPFEATLTFQEFTMSESELISKQTDDWIAYLDSEIALLDELVDGPEKDIQRHLITSLFERALVPNFSHTGIWYKYIEFTEKHSASDALNIYRRAIFKFLPLKEHIIREKYVKLLKNEKGFDAANEFLSEILRLYSGSENSRFFVKTPYVHTLIQICELWSLVLARTELMSVLEHLVTSYFDRTDRYKRDRPKPGNDETMKLKSAYISTVSKYLNDDGVCVVAVQYLNLLKIELDATETIRKFYNRFHTESVFSRSVQFWKFFVEFEGYGHKNLMNLRSVTTYIKTTTALPKMAIDTFLDIYYEITCANLAQAMALSGKENYLDILLKIHSEKSDDLYVNTAARTRLTRNNHLIPEAKPGQALSKEDTLMKLRAKHIAHPGVFVDARPEITNCLMDQGWISLLDDKIEPPALPRFRNMDKAHTPVHYPEE